MKKNDLLFLSLWNSALLVSAVFVAFIVPVIPFHMQKTAFSLGIAAIYISALFSLEKKNKYFTLITVAAILIQWISDFFNFELLYDISKSIGIIFFLTIVFVLIHQIATAREVSVKVILGSIAGYLILGIVFSFFILMVLRRVPDAYANLIAGNEIHKSRVDASPVFYYSFVTLASLGYGDIVPLKPVSRSLATLIAVSGQFYIAVIVAMLVGKFASRKH